MMLKISFFMDWDKLLFNISWYDSSNILFFFDSSILHLIHNKFDEEKINWIFFSSS